MAVCKAAWVCVYKLLKQLHLLAIALQHPLVEVVSGKRTVMRQILKVAGYVQSLKRIKHAMAVAVLHVWRRHKLDMTLLKQTA